MVIVSTSCLRVLSVLLPVATGLPAMAAQTDSSEPARLYHTREEQREVGRHRQLTPWLTASGLAELEWSKQYIAFANDTDNDHRQDDSATVQLALTATPWEPLIGELIFEYDTDDDNLFADEATLAVEADPWELVMGKQYFPFGTYFSRFVTDPLLQFGETRDTGATVAYAIGDRWDVSVSGYQGRASQVDRNDRGLDWVLALEAWPTDFLSFGLSYQTDLADADSRLLADEDDRYSRRVPAVSGYLLWVADTFEVTLEALAATRSFRELDRDRDRPQAWNLEFAHFPHASFDWALRVEGSRDLEDAPRLQYGAAVTFRVRRYAALTLELLHGRFRGELATDDDDNPFDHVTQLGAQLSIAL